MDPEDSFSPPLSGLSRGKKIHQLLTTLDSSDHVVSTDRLDIDQGDYDVSGLLEIDEIAGLENDETAFAALTCGWWHMEDEDWWKYSYLEAGPEGGFEELDESEEGSHALEITYQCTWAREANDKVDGLTFFEDRSGSEDAQAEPFDPEFEALKPLTRAIVDTHLVNNIQERY